MRTKCWFAGSSHHRKQLPTRCQGSESDMNDEDRYAIYSHSKSHCFLRKKRENYLTWHGWRQPLAKTLHNQESPKQNFFCPIIIYHLFILKKPTISFVILHRQNNRVGWCKRLNFHKVHSNPYFLGNTEAESRKEGNRLLNYLAGTQCGIRSSWNLKHSRNSLQPVYSTVVRVTAFRPTATTRWQEYQWFPLPSIAWEARWWRFAASKQYQLINGTNQRIINGLVFPPVDFEPWYENGEKHATNHYTIVGLLLTKEKKPNHALSRQFVGKL